jgi:TRAP-type C4-dicarboxylate transport system permease small subunit
MQGGNYMRIIKWIDKHFEESLLVLLLLLIAMVMLLQVIMRYVFNNSLPWPEEFSRYCYVWTTFLSLGFTIKYGNMLKVGILMDYLPNTLRSVMHIITQLIITVFFSTFFYYSFEVVESIKKMGQTSTAMSWPMNLVYLCTIVGFGLGMIRSIQVLISSIKNFGKKGETTLEAIKKEAEAEAHMAALD